jgi:hypothetical protein
MFLERGGYSIGWYHGEDGIRGLKIPEKIRRTAVEDKITLTRETEGLPGNAEFHIMNLPQYSCGLRCPFL